MKKLLVMAIGMGLVLGTVSFAQDTTDKKMDDTKTTKKTKKMKKAKKPATDTSSDKKM